MGVKLPFFVVSGDHSLRVFGNRVLKKIFGPKQEVVTREWRTTHIIRVISSKERDGRDMWHEWGYLHTWFRWGNLRVGGHLKNCGVEGRLIVTRDFINKSGCAWTGFIWLRIRTGVILLLIR